MDLKQATKLIYETLGTVYCNNCRRNDEDDERYEDCDDCHRKMMAWGINIKAAEKLATKILK